MSWYGFKPPKDFHWWLLAAFLGGFGGGIVHRVLFPESLLWLLALGVLGGGVGLWVLGQSAGGRPESVLSGLIAISAPTLGLSYVSLPGAGLAFVLLR